jgi:hypothetical protein
MRFNFLIFILGVATLSFSDNLEKSDTLGFHCMVLHPEKAEYPEVTVSSDTVTFRLFYVDDKCSGFTYRFSKKENLLLIQRISSASDTCTTEEQFLYGVEGFITNVPKGKYIFELQTGPDETKQTSIYRDAVTIKKRSGL